MTSWARSVLSRNAQTRLAHKSSRDALPKVVGALGRSLGTPDRRGLRLTSTTSAATLTPAHFPLSFSAREKVHLSWFQRFFYKVGVAPKKFMPKFLEEVPRGSPAVPLGRRRSVS